MPTPSFSLKHLCRPSSLSPKKAPLLIMLHGYGSNEQDLFSFADQIDEKYFIVSARAPQPVQTYGHAWYSIDFDADGIKSVNDREALKSCTLILRFIDEVIANYQLTPSKITLFGFSQGAILSYILGLSHPEKINQVVALSGYIHRDWLPKDYRENDFSDLAFYSSHGTADPVVPVALDRQTKPFLANLGISCHYSEFPVGHGVAPDNFKEIQAWLKQTA